MNVSQVRLGPVTSQDRVYKALPCTILFIQLIVRFTRRETGSSYS